MSKPFTLAQLRKIVADKSLPKLTRALAMEHGKALKEFGARAGATPTASDETILQRDYGRAVARIRELEAELLEATTKPGQREPHRTPQGELCHHCKRHDARGLSSGLTRYMVCLSCQATWSVDSRDGSIFEPNPQHLDRTPFSAPRGAVLNPQPLTRG